MLCWVQSVQHADEEDAHLARRHAPSCLNIGHGGCAFSGGQNACRFHPIHFDPLRTGRIKRQLSSMKVGGTRALPAADGAPP